MAEIPFYYRLLQTAPLRPTCSAERVHAVLSGHRFEKSNSHEERLLNLESLQRGSNARGMLACSSLSVRPAAARATRGAPRGTRATSTKPPWPGGGGDRLATIVLPSAGCVLAHRALRGDGVDRDAGAGSAGLSAVTRRSSSVQSCADDCVWRPRPNRLSLCRERHAVFVHETVHSDVDGQPGFEKWRTGKVA